MVFTNWSAIEKLPFIAGSSLNSNPNCEGFTITLPLKETEYVNISLLLNVTIILLSGDLTSIVCAKFLALIKRKKRRITFLSINMVSALSVYNQIIISLSFVTVRNIVHYN